MCYWMGPRASQDTLLFGGEKNLFFPLWMESWFLGLPATSLVAIVTELLCVWLVFISFFWSLGVESCTLVEIKFVVEHRPSWQRQGGVGGGGGGSMVLLSRCIRIKPWVLLNTLQVVPQSFSVLTYWQWCELNHKILQLSNWT